MECRWMLQKMSLDVTEKCRWMLQKCRWMLQTVSLDVTFLKLSG